MLNYGIPSLAGRIRTADGLRRAGREVEPAIERFEPRMRGVRVRPEGHEGDLAYAAR